MKTRQYIKRKPRRSIFSRNDFKKPIDNPGSPNDPRLNVAKFIIYLLLLSAIVYTLIGVYKTESLPVHIVDYWHLISNICFPAMIFLFIQQKK